MRKLEIVDMKKIKGGDLAPVPVLEVVLSPAGFFVLGAAVAVGCWIYDNYVDQFKHISNTINIII